MSDKRAPVQRDCYERRCRYGHANDAPEHHSGTIAWEEHLAAWDGYAKDGHGSQSAERVAERGGFGMGELKRYLGRYPATFIADE